MKYFLDTEFNGFGGELLSLALVSEHGDALYLVIDPPADIEPWVAENVMPIMYSVPDRTEITFCTMDAAPQEIADFFGNSSGGVPYIITDWPDDVRYLCQAVITGPGMMAPIARMQFDVVRVDAYPTTLPGAVQHNALWDAYALRERLFPGSFESARP
ncbi:hypothetical protein [Sphingomonas sp. T9W2]|uniref:hypothetical protein n=1 Tax=Sphingomonas sp. T9W2 TaxID=3143183 RepID=UPI0031F5BAF1